MSLYTFKSNVAPDPEKILRDNHLMPNDSNVNSCIPTQTPEQDYSDHMYSPG